MTPLDANPPEPESASLTKAQLAELLFDHIGLNKRESKDLVDAFFELIAQQLVAGNEVKLSGFGNFQIRTKAPRPGRNPRTGESIPIGARSVVTFTPAASSRSRSRAEQANDGGAGSVPVWACMDRSNCLQFFCRFPETPILPLII